MAKMGFMRRFVGPVGSTFLVTALSYACYMLSPKIPGYTLFRIVAVISGVVLFISLGLGTLYVYPALFRRGAPVAERIVGSLVTPFLWMTKEVVIIGGVYTAGEALYYYLNPIHLLLLSAVIAEMGAAQLWINRALVKGGARRRAWSLPALVTILIGLGWFAFMFIWDLGVHHFYIFQEGYKALFGYGVGI